LSTRFPPSGRGRTIPGHFYDLEEEACVVVSLLPESEVFAEGLERLGVLVGEG
jgi:hypothetical protein